jgi:hypothetical protein
MRLDVLQWAWEHGCPWDAKRCKGAAVEGYLEVLQWAREQGDLWDARDVSHQAAFNEILEIVQWVQVQL